MPTKKDWGNSRDYLPGDRVRVFTREQIGSVVQRTGENTVRVRFEQGGEEEVSITDLKRLDR
jgi:hypothetical protein